MTKSHFKYWAVVAMLTLTSNCSDTTDSEDSADAGEKGETKPRVPKERFSFFVTSYAALTRLSGSESGFGGDLRYGERDGLTGADKICTEIAEGSMPGSGKKRWRAFLSVTRGPKGTAIHARDRIGDGPWYDRLGRIVAENLSDLLNVRPLGAHSAIVDDLPNEDGVPNHAPDGKQVDNHDILTGSDVEGKVYTPDDWGSTCHDWTSAVGTDGKPRVGHSWPRRLGGANGSSDGDLPDATELCGDGGTLGDLCVDGGLPNPTTLFGGDGGAQALCGDGGFLSGFCVDGKLPDFGSFFGDGGIPSFGDAGFGFGGPAGGGDFSGEHWISSLTEAGCAPGASLIEMGPPIASNPTVGSGGGYGGFYCFALTP